MTWCVIAGVVAVVAAAAWLGRRRARRRRGWARWVRDQRSGALAWRLFQRRPRVPRLEDRRRGPPSD